jgi:hypothetical protein
MTFSFPSSEFDDAVAAVCHGTATETEMRRLNELLRGDPRARDEYLIRVELHARLASEPDLFSQETEVTGGGDPPGVGRGDRPETTSPHVKARFARRRLVQALALAACLILTAAGVGIAWLRKPTTGIGTTSTAIAMLARAVEARWAEGTAPLRVGSALDPGWLRLESGLAQVVFYSGVRVVIEGPAELRLVSLSEAVCPTGRLLAEVPPPARGFRLRTDQLSVLDLGTEFAVDATPARTEIHVFKGKVELNPGTATERSLDAGQAAVVRENAPPRFMAANAAGFTPMFEFQKRSLASEAIRYDQWRLTSARLNQDPSLVVRLDFDDLSASNYTLRNAAANQRSVPDATIVGCQRGEGRWREKRALEFQSVNDRVRLAVPGDFEALTLSAWVRVKGLDRKFNSLLMCDGFEPGTIHWLIRNDGVLGLTVFGPGTGNFQILATPPVLTLDQFGMWLHLAVVVDGETRQVVHYLNGSAVSRHALKLGPPFQLGAVELGNWNAQSDHAPAPFLIRNLSGSLDEFELFSRALTDAELRELYVKGKPEL